MHPVHQLDIPPDQTSPATPTERTDTARTDASQPRPETAAAPAAPCRPVIPLPRRQRPWLLVVVDPDPAGQPTLIWALREAARREATVVAVSIEVEASPDDETMTGWPSAAAHDTRLADLRARVRSATAEAGVRPPVRTAVLDAQVFEALAGAARGADLVVVGTHGKTLLRPAVARSTTRRPARPA